MIVPCSMQNLLSSTALVIIMKITVKGFAQGEPIPRKFTCDGEDVSPEIAIEGVPADAKSLVLIMDDPDAPVGLFTHWIAYNMPPETKLIAEGAGNGKMLHHGMNDFGKAGYGGSCPPPGKPHRYYFTIYALNTERIEGGARRSGIDADMKGKILEKASYMGTYER